jgi:hypothetical protein
MKKISNIFNCDLCEGRFFKNEKEIKCKNCNNKICEDCFEEFKICKNKINCKKFEIIEENNILKLILKEQEKNLEDEEYDSRFDIFSNDFILAQKH